MLLGVFVVQKKKKKNDCKSAKIFENVCKTPVFAERMEDGI